MKMQVSLEVEDTGALFIPLQYSTATTNNFSVKIIMDKNIFSKLGNVD